MVHIIRTTIMFTAVIVIMRFMGKRQIGQLQPYELVIAMMISDLASIPLQDNTIPLINGFLPILTLMVLQILISFLIMKFKFLRNIICGKPCVLIKNGVIIKENLKKQMYNLDDLLETLRLQGSPDVGSIQLAVLENNGNVSISLYPQKSPATKEDVKECDFSQTGILTDIIIGGYLLKDNMRMLGITYRELSKELQRRGHDNPHKVFYCYIDSQGEYHVQ